MDWIRRMLTGLRSLPLKDFEEFTESPVNIAGAESYLRRALEGLLDLARHVLAKGFGRTVAEYKLISPELEDVGVLTPETAKILRILAGYRNRMVHFYFEVSNQELYEICVNELSDIEKVLDEILHWINENPNRINHEL
jgi:uncharacterized protein YutE (UPF0331/DUF86 family)